MSDQSPLAVLRFLALLFRFFVFFAFGRGAFFAFSPLDDAFLILLFRRFLGLRLEVDSAFESDLTPDRGDGAR